MEITSLQKNYFKLVKARFHPIGIFCSQLLNWGIHGALIFLDEIKPTNQSFTLNCKNVGIHHDRSYRCRKDLFGITRLGKRGKEIRE